MESCSCVPNLPSRIYKLPIFPSCFSSHTLHFSRNFKKLTRLPTWENLFSHQNYNNNELMCSRVPRFASRPRGGWVEWVRMEFWWLLCTMMVMVMQGCGLCYVVEMVCVAVLVWSMRIYKLLIPLPIDFFFTTSFFEGVLKYDWNGVTGVSRR